MTSKKMMAAILVGLFFIGFGIGFLIDRADAATTQVPKPDLPACTPGADGTLCDLGPTWNRIAKCESRGVYNVEADHAYTRGYGSFGLLQFNQQPGNAWDWIQTSSKIPGINNDTLPQDVDIVTLLWAAEWLAANHGGGLNAWTCWAKYRHNFGTGPVLIKGPVPQIEKIVPTIWDVVAECRQQGRTGARWGTLAGGLNAEGIDGPANDQRRAASALVANGFHKWMNADGLNCWQAFIDGRWSDGVTTWEVGNLD